MRRNSIRRPGLVLLSLLLPALPLAAQDGELRELLRDALYAEEVTRDTDEAARQYEALLSRHDAQRAYAASALFRLAEVRRKQDRKDDAVRLYQRLLREFPQAEAESKLARENLAALGVEAEDPGTTPAEDDARELARLRRLVTSSPDRLKDPALLVDAIKDGRIPVIDYLFKAGAAGKPGGLLLEAVGTGNLEVVAWLLDHHPEQARPSIGSALFKAVAADRQEITRLLLDRGADPNAEGTYRAPIDMMRAPFPGLPPGFSPAPVEGGSRMTVLHMAVRKGDAALCKLLLEHKADPNRLIRFSPGLDVSTGWNFQAPAGTPLHDAVLAGPEFVQLLLEHGADVKAAYPENGFTPLHSAARSSSERVGEIIGLLLEKGATLDAKSVVPPYPDMPDSVTWRSPVTSIDARVFWDQATPLKVAFAWQNPLSARSMIEAGAAVADPDLQMLAANLRNPEWVSLIFSAEKKPAVSEEAFEQAVKTGIEEAVRAFLDAGADPASFTPDRQSGLLQFVAMRSDAASPAMLKLLIDHGAKPDPAWLEQNFKGAKKEHLPALYRHFLVPRLKERETVSLIAPAFGDIPPGEIAARQGDAPPLPLASLLLAHRKDWPGLRDAILLPLQVTVFRKAQGDTVTVRLESADPLPELGWGDVIELSPDFDSPDAIKPELSYNFRLSNEMPPEVRWHLMKRTAFPVTFEVNGQIQALTLRGDRLIHDPTSEEVPLSTAGILASLRSQGIPGADVSGSSITITRRDWPEIRLPFPSPEASGFPLRSGDGVKLDISPRAVEAASAMRAWRIGVRAAGLPYGWWIECSFRNAPQTRVPVPPTAIPELLPTLFQILTQTQALPDTWPLRPETAPESIPRLLPGTNWPHTVLPDPDWSSIRILRLKEDGEEEIIETDLSRWIGDVGASPEEIKKHDIPLQPGDIVELQVRKDRPGQPWKGLSEKEQSFFTKALQGQVQVVGADSQVRLEELRYQPPRYVETPAGWIPVPPASGRQSVLAKSFFGEAYADIELIRNGESFGRVDSAPLFLRDGDQIKEPRTTTIFGQPTMPQRGVPSR